VNHVRREANGVAYRLAKETLSLIEEQVNMEESPLCILDIVTIEYCNI
jgi:hypothetical protein